MRKYLQLLHEKIGDFWWYSALVFVATRVGDLIQAFIGLWLVPKYVPQSELGATLPIVQAASTLGIPLSILVIPFARWLTIYSSRGELGKVKRLLKIAFLFAGVAFLVTMVFARLLLPAFFERARIEEGSLGLLILAAGIATPFSGVFVNALQGLKRFNALAVLQSVFAPIRLVVMLVAMPFRAISGYMLGQIATPVTNIIGACIALQKDLSHEVKSVPLGRSDIMDMLRYSMPVVVYMTSGIVMGSWQSLLFRQRLPEIESAGYYMISRLAETATYAGAALVSVMTPIIAETKARGLSEKGLLTKLFAGTLLPGVALTLFFLFFGDWVLGLVAVWRDYVGYSNLMTILTLRTCLLMTASVFFTYEISAGRFRFLLYWLPFTLLDTGGLVALTGYGAFYGILPDGVVDWMASLRAARLSFFIYWLLGVTTLQAIVIGIHLLLRHRCATRKGGAR